MDQGAPRVGRVADDECLVSSQDQPGPLAQAQQAARQIALTRVAAGLTPPRAEASDPSVTGD